MPQNTLPDPEATAARYEEFLRYFSADCERIYAYIYSLLPHHADADDVFQRCSLLLWEKFAHFDQERSFLSWSCGVAFYEVKNFLRSARRDRLQFSEELVELLAQQRAENLPEPALRLAALRKCLNLLTSHQQQLIWSVYGSGQAVTELAAASGRSAQTLYNQLLTIRRKLADCVQLRLTAPDAQEG